MSSNLNANQFKQTAIKGMLTFGVNLNTITARVDAASDPIFPGDAVAISGDSSTTTLIVQKAANDADEMIIGVCRYDPKGAGSSTQSYGPGKLIEVAFDNAFMIVEAGESILQGAELRYEADAITGNGQFFSTVTEEKEPWVGVSITAAPAEGDLFVMLIKTPLINQVIPANTIPFNELIGVPLDYGTVGQVLRVASDGESLEYFTNSFLLLSDTPNTYVGAASNTVQVNAGATALVFTLVP